MKELTPETIAAISTALVGVTQLVKWAGLPSKWAPPVLAILSTGAVLLYVYKPYIFQVAVASALVTMAASGVYGFATRVAPADPGTSTTTTTSSSANTSGGSSEFKTIVVDNAEKQKEPV